MGIDDLISLSSKNLHVDLTQDAWNRVSACRDVVEKVIHSGQRVYGVNTGFGSFSKVPVSKENLAQLQVNLIR